jgi:NlpC/P60 family
MDVRNLIVAQARQGVADRAHFVYKETRPMPLTWQFPITTDCSGFVTLCYKLAGAADPNGLRYNGEGYTGTLLTHGRLITLAEVLPGDVIVYGPGNGWHTAIVVVGGADPLTVSMGQQGDPSYVHVSGDGRLPQRYLRFDTSALIVPHPAPAKVEPAPVKKVAAAKPATKQEPVSVNAATSGGHGTA